jgi:hypothetical protein
LRAQQEVVEIDHAELPLLRVEEREEPPREREQRHRRAVADQPVVDAAPLVAVAQDLQRLLEDAVAGEVRLADRRGDVGEVGDAVVERIDARRGLAEVREDAARVLVARVVGAAPDGVDGILQLLADLVIRPEVVLGLVQQVAALREAEDQVADLEEVTGVLKEELPLLHHFRPRIDARLLIQPGVVCLSVEQRALESLHDLELRIQPRLDRKRAQQRLAEGVDGLRAEGVDVGEVMGDRGARALRIGDGDERVGGPDGPARDVFVQLLERTPDPVRDLSRRFLGERHQHDALGSEVLVREHQLQHLGHDGGGLAGASAGFDDHVAGRGRRIGSGPGRRLRARCEVEGLLQRHAISPRSVRGSLCCATA